MTPLPDSATALAPSAAARPGVWTRYWRWAWLIAMLGSLDFVYRPSDQVSQDLLSPDVLGKALAAVLVAMMVLPWLVRWPRGAWTGPLAWLGALGLWRLATCGWSIEPAWSLLRGGEYLVVLTLTALCARTLGATDLGRWANWVWAFLAAGVLSALVGAALWPQAALIRVDQALVPVQLWGVCPRIHPTGLAQSAAVLALVGITRWLNRGFSWPRLGMAALGLVVMPLTQGRAAMAGFVLGLLTLRHGPKPFRLLFVALLVVLAAGLLAGPVVDWGQEFVMRGQTPHMFLGLSTRGQMWTQALHRLDEGRWLTGYGAFAGGRWFSSELAPPGSHLPPRVTVDNAWLELWLDAGLVGVALLAVPVVWMWARLWRLCRRGDFAGRALAVEALAVLTVVAFRSFFVSSMTQAGAFEFLYAAGAAVVLAQSPSPPPSGGPPR